MPGVFIGRHSHAFHKTQMCPSLDNARQWRTVRVMSEKKAQNVFSYPLHRCSDCWEEE